MTRPRSSGERLAEAQALAHLGSWDWDIPANRVEWSDEMFRIHGYTPQQFDVTFEKAIEPVVPDDALRIRAELERIFGEARTAFETGKPGPHTVEPIEYRITRCDGQERILQGQGHLFLSPSGEPLRMVGTVLDVTGRSRVLEALTRAEQRYREVFEHSPLGIFRATPDGQVLLANPALARMLGYQSPEELSRLNMAQDVYWDAEERRRLVTQYESGEGPWEVELRWKRRDGRPIWVSTSTHAARDDAGRVRYFQTYVQDITQQRRSREVLRDITEGVLATGDEFFRSVVLRLSSTLGVSHAFVGELVPGGQEQVSTIVAAADGTIVDNFIYALAGTPCANVVRQRTCSFRSRVREEFPDDTLLREMGSESYVGTPLFASSGAPLGLIAVLDRKPLEEEDLTRQMLEVFATRAAAELERRRAEEAVRKGRARLRALSHRLLDVQEQERRYIARELHDQIGQALTAVKLNLQSIDNGDTDRSIRRALRDVVLLVDTAIQQVRTLSFDLRPPMLDDLGLAAALGSYARRQATGAGLQLVLHIDAALDGLTKDVETACFRIAQEAITNVVRHARAQRLDVRVQRDNGTVELIVEDDGKGIATALEDDTLASGPGILGMRERAEAAGGVLELGGGRAGGTVVRARFPALATSVEPSR